MTNNLPSPDISHQGYMHRASANVTLTALTAGDVVYIRILKCASSFFHNNFAAWGWSPIRFESINWRNQRVFAHMLDPLERRYKGAAEYINMNGLGDRITDPQFRNFISTIPVFDNHTASYHEQLGPYTRLIDWIPISGRSPKEACRLTETLLLDHNIHILDRWNWDHARPADNYLKNLQSEVKSALEETYQDGVYRYLLNDCLLYEHVCAHFNPEGNTWTDISWLSNLNK